MVLETARELISHSNLLKNESNQTRQARTDLVRPDVVSASLDSVDPLRLHCWKRGDRNLKVVRYIGAGECRRPDFHVCDDPELVATHQALHPICF